jgi:outer membrane protein OmpA-like peptidoglycan-associated protein
MRRDAATALLLAAALLTASCTAAADPEATDGDQQRSSNGGAEGEGTQADGSASTAPADPVHLTDREVLGSGASTDRDDLELEVTGLERVDDGVLALNWQIRNISSQPANVNTLFGTASVRVRGIWLVDGSRQARPFEDEAENCLCLNLAEKNDNIEPGEVKHYRSLHPDLGTDTLTVRPFGFADIPDIPISEPVLSAVADPGSPAVVVAAADEGVTLEIHPLERHDDVAVLRATVVNDSAATFTPNMTRFATDGTVTGLLGTTGYVSFVAGEVHHRVLADDRNRCYCVSRATTQPGERKELMWAFDAPADDVSHVTLSVPWFGAVPGVPVVDANGPLRLELDHETLEQVAPGGDERHRLIASIEEVEDDMVTRVIESGGDTTDIALAADVLFDFDDDTLRPDADPLVDDLVAMLEDAGTLTGPVVVEGHTDSVGAPAYNLELSERRARSVLDAIEARLDRTDLSFEVVGRGQEDPVEENNTDEGRQRNRRVTVKIPSDG